MDNQLLEQLLDNIRNRYYGKYRATVTDITDTTNRGRIKAKVPGLNNLEVWAVPCLPYTGKGMGTYMVPDVGAGVWIEFEAGDPSYAIWSGGFWADNELPKNEKGTAATPSLKIIRSSKGMMMAMDDSAQVITISDDKGDNIMTIEVQQGIIKIKGKTKVIVEAPQIELVENAAHPVVFGDNLLTYLNQVVQVFQAHTHAGEMAGSVPVTPAPPAMPMPAPTSSLLSTKVKTG